MEPIEETTAPDQPAGGPAWIRLQAEERERRELSEHATLAAHSKGRDHPEPECLLRTAFQRDRDRIIHQCKSFRRLAGKTQVFLPATDDHVRTRLTHTLEVCQIARTIGRALRLNEDLIEAIALGHDLGHTPFGHSGERALSEAIRELDSNGGFTHTEQSLRVVEQIERDGQGVNLTFEVRDGIRHHSKGASALRYRLDGDVPGTLEAKVVRWCDRIAYVNHDLDDARRAGILFDEDVSPGILERLGHSHSERITTLVTSIIESSQGEPFLAMAPTIADALEDLKDFLFERVYVPSATRDYPGSRGEHIVRELFRHYMDNPDAAPFLRPHERELPLQDRIRLTTDFVAGMTDRFACDTYVRLFIPSPRPGLLGIGMADL